MDERAFVNKVANGVGFSFGELGGGVVSTLRGN